MLVVLRVKFLRFYGGIFFNHLFLPNFLNFKAGLHNQCGNCMNKCINLILGFIVLLLFSNTTKSQTYAINNGFTYNQTVTTCSGTFYDSNISGNYGAFEDYTVTFSPGNPGRVMQMNFLELAVGTGDTLFVFDGPSTLNSVIDTFTAVSFSYAQSVFATDTNTNGSLTFKFKSNGTSQALGWKAEIKCGYPCKQRIIGNIATTPGKDTNGNTNICLTASGKVQFNLATSYPENGTIYNQADTSSYFHWFWGDGKDTVRKNLTNVSHTYAQEGGYNIRLIITDSNGCVNRLPITAKVRTGIKPVFKITAPANICVGDSVKLTPSAFATFSSGGFVTPLGGSFLTLPVSGDSLFLPDGSGVTYTSNIFISQFAQGQTLTNINDLKGIFMNMEHSYLGDLNISITAPNGVTVNLKSYPGGSSCFLGEPVDEPTGTSTTSPLFSIAGKGYTYSFNSTPTHGTMVAESTNFSYSFIDNSGVAQNNKKYLPSGSYASSASLNALVGTPLNGTWTLQIKDNLAIDNGFLFNWRLEFNPALFPNVETYDVPIISQNWTTPANGLVNVTGTIANIQPDMAGNLSYFYRVIDTFGCVFDTTIKIVAVASPVKPNLGNDIAFCNGQSSVNLTVANPDNTAFYTWSNGANGVAATVFTPDTYIVTANNSTGCKSRDTINVNPPENVTVNLGIDTMFCATAPNLLKPVVSNNVVGYLWNNGTTKDTLRISAPGTYSVKVTTNNGCFLTDEIIVGDNPVNNFRMPIDTIICEKSSYIVTLNIPINTTTIVWNDGVIGSVRSVTGTNVYSTIANNVGCLKQSSYRVDVKPLPVVNLGPDITLCNSKTIVLKASYPGASYLWNDNTTDSTLLANAAKVYWVEALYNQCTYRDSIEVKYVKCDCNTVVPNAFSPNGDGINEGFGPKMECVPAQYQMSIFNRYGQVIFETKDYTKTWDGTLNGKPMPVGTYYYVLNYFNPGLAIPERFAGSITIIR